MNDLSPATRRAFLQALTAASGLVSLRQASAQTDAEKAHAQAMELLKPGSEKIAILIYPSFTALDAIGPQHMLAGMTGASVKFIAASAEPVKTDSGYFITPQLTFDQCPEQLDLLLIPGGSGLAHAFGGPCLADRQQPHLGGISPGGHGGPGNAHDKVLEAAGKA